ncbi:hypothetical protein HG536_0H04810 [Torulaspora globosa]|uniref:Uncharacterized protein n=1 Tax=Torulaspora globosa TaxID=48254 RepID=A0A7G3ZNL9_9SACH|nr:uncharacterized protein HG536_0H04810 [Torulaspora globosa]QLL35105.1 hypothetical protein HG536_0H04810 [Torulaspora globosa]
MQYCLSGPIFPQISKQPRRPVPELQFRRMMDSVKSSTPEITRLCRISLTHAPTHAPPPRGLRNCPALPGPAPTAGSPVSILQHFGAVHHLCQLDLQGLGTVAAGASSRNTGGALLRAKVKFPAYCQCDDQLNELGVDLQSLIGCIKQVTSV